MEHQKRIMNQKGFTLIEIIAVLVILGIMASVAIPKYLNMQQQAANDAANGATAAAAANASMVYANMLINGTASITSATLVSALNVATYTTVGDYTAAYAALANTNVGVSITVTAPANVTAPTANTTKNVTLVP